jgi:malonate-semialdehyde dehydrogenase (acetylating)/methylmalonate-semialdehyde dehydrogenase
MSSVAAPPLTKVSNYINGQWQNSSAKDWQDVINPATGEVIASVPLSDVAEVTQAIELAAAAYPA